MALKDIDTARFIQLIRARSVLWDISLEDYSNKNRKELAWLEICNELFVNFDRLDQHKKIKIGNHLQKRWKSLRNCYSRELRRAKEPDSGSRKKYIYFEQLSFLNQNLKHRTGSCLDEEEMDLDANYQEVSVFEEQVKLENNKPDYVHKISTNTNDEELLRNTFPYDVESISEGEESQTRRNHTHRTSSDFDKLYELLRKCLKLMQPQESFNGDKMFLLSLLPDLQEVPPERKLSAKMEILNVISNYKTSSILPNSGVSQNYAVAYSSSETASNLVTIDNMKEARSDLKQEPHSPDISIQSTHI